MMERLVRFGEGDRLCGVLSNGAAEPAILTHNAGIVHRVGPHRMNVRISRAFAELGHATLRFDLSGQGDSDRGPQTLGFAEQALEDLRAATDLATDAAGVDRVAVIGLCSATDSAINAALTDDRVVAIGLLDPWAYPSPGSQMRHLISRASDARRVTRKISSLTGKLLGGGDAREPDDRTVAPGAAFQEADGLGMQLDFDTLRTRPPLEDFGADLEAITDAGKRVYIAYSSLEKQMLTASKHFFDTFKDFDFKGRLEVDVKMDVDHTYSEMAAHRAMVDRLTGWVRDRR